MEKTVGILGGMGPEAGCEFLRRLIRRTPVQKDQDHLQAILYNQPKIPDRSSHILVGAPSPLDDLIQAVRKLESWGSDFIAIPCNTAHYYFSSLVAAVGIPILDIIEVTVRDVVEIVGKSGRVGVLATRATIATGLFQKALTKRGLLALCPDESLQLKLHSAIWTLKSGRGFERAAADISRVAGQLVDQGAEVLILGCTELGLVLHPQDFSVPIVDSLDSLAQATIEYATIPVHEPTR